MDSSRIFLSYLFFVRVHCRREEGLYGITPNSSTLIAVFFKEDLKTLLGLAAQGFQGGVKVARNESYRGITPLAGLFRRFF
jgi:hypothetical protein